MTPPNDVETRLRAALAEHARHAPPGGPVADRILAELDAPVLRPRHGWRTWTFPLLAAAAIAAVALTLVGVSNIHFSASNNNAATQLPTVTRTPPSPSATSSVATPTTPAPQSTAAAVYQPIAGLPNFQAIDTTYYSDQRAWALGSADCSATNPQPCAALATSTDAGTSWHQLGLPNGLSIPLRTCPAGCVTGVRFATVQIGYLFGPSTFLVTTDGGANWSPIAGGAVAVETLNQTVIRVAKADPGCAGSCRYTVRYSDIDATTWHAAQIPTLTGDSVQLLRTPGNAYLLVRQGGTGRLLHSTDGGAKWVTVPTCGQVRQVAVNTHSLNLLCGDQIRVDANTSSAKSVAGPGGGSVTELSAVGAHTLFVVSDRLWRSTDSGGTWHVVLNAPVGSDLGPPGFQSETLGRWINDGGRTVWTTRNGGATWSGVAFSK
ncbi:MAG TPA: hypothetical protein VGH43_06045 [Jatrophihabitans sp.]|jgi:photosystem II stability/assembly factor-like uncharacterized protein